ncbi:MAG: family 43 glycosylhydrolase [Nibricoccus sp.]
MKKLLFGCLPKFSLALLGACCVQAAPLTLTLPVPTPPESGYFKMGASRRPDGRMLTIDSQSLRLDGRPWLPVMGEFHFTRYPQSEWRDELYKMRAGGIDIVATYVFWIHHEEEEGVFNWSGQRDLRKFVELAREAGLAVVVRCGPWCHGEVRNGGLPDWVLKKGFKARSNDPAYLEKARSLYAQIATQLKGLLWKDGGPVVGVQVENEYSGPAEHLMALKGIAREVGLDVPFYTRTGWPNLRTPAPLGELLPLYGSYADGFWLAELTSMPGDNWTRFLFPTTRVDTNIGADLLGKQKSGDAEDALKYPFLTCELGGGMATSYHRRVLVDPRDVESIALLHVGAGSNLPGYYMYHGGTNPEGKLSTLQESQATNYPNDLPVKTYDFQAPLGEYGQTRPHYHALRRLHLFLRDFGSALAGMPPALPPDRPKDADDVTTLRWAVRSNGQSGFVFINNYHRLKPMPAKPDVQFALTLVGGGTLTFPEQPVTVPADRAFFWPFNFDLGGALLKYATAQPICRVDEGDLRTIFFAQTPGVPAEFVFPSDGLSVQAVSGKMSKEGDRFRVTNVAPGLGAAIRMINKAGAVFQIVLLDDADSLALWKARWQGRERVFLTRSDLIVEKDSLRLASNEPGVREVAMSPAPPELMAIDKRIPGETRGVFRSFKVELPTRTAASCAVERLHAPGPARQVTLGNGKKPVALAPTEADFANAGVWRITVPSSIDLSRNPLLQVRYVGDVARFSLNGRLITDQFYNGVEFDLGLARHAPEMVNGELKLEILPLRKDAPIYLADSAKPDFGNGESVAALTSVEIIYRDEVRLKAAEPAIAQQPFSNPLVRQQADPFVIRHTDGNYYFIATAPEFDRIEVRRASSIAGLKNAEPVVIWKKHATGPMSSYIWAPELHFIDGKWYIYFAAGGLEKEWGIRIYTLENASADPLAPTWVEKGQFKTAWESFALDATTFAHRGKRYFVWAQQDKAIRGNTNLYIVEMDSPMSIVGKPVMLSKPDLPWEQVLYWVNEGPAVLKKNGRIFITYSASGTDANYCMGMLTASENADLLDAKSWTKSPEPVFRTNADAGVYGPGHNSFTVMPDGQTDVLIYHARNYEKIVGNPLRDPNRHARAQILHWKPDGTPDFGRPAPDAAPDLEPELF